MLVDNAIDIISTERSNFGAQQNRLEHAYAIDTNTSENTQAAESRIRDANMADESMANSLLSVLQQAGQSMIAQANETPQGVLQLLQ
jgi:flagellin-like hook-associated protein FlgL